MNQSNPTRENTENQRFSPLSFNKVFNDAEMTAKEKMRRMRDASNESRRILGELYLAASPQIQLCILRDLTEAFLCLYTKYEDKVERTPSEQQEVTAQ